MKTKTIIILSALATIAGAKAQTAAIPTSQSVTTTHGNTSVTTNYDLVPAGPKLDAWTEATLQIAKRIKDSEERHKTLAEAQAYIAVHDSGNMLAAQPERMDDDGRIVEFLKAYGYRDITSIMVDRVRQVMSDRHILRVWDLVKEQ